MEWQRAFGRDRRPTPEDFDLHMEDPLWLSLRGWLEETYGAAPVVEYSCCSFAPGWNMKYKKSGRSICTLYPGLPGEGRFTALVVVSDRDTPRAEAILPDCDPYMQELYRQTEGGKGSRWLMIDIASPRILEDAKALMTIRVKPPQRRRDH